MRSSPRSFGHSLLTRLLPPHEPPFSKAVRIFVPPGTKIRNRRFMAAMGVRTSEVGTTHEPGKLSQGFKASRDGVCPILEHFEFMGIPSGFMVPRRARMNMKATHEPTRRAARFWTAPVLWRSGVWQKLRGLALHLRGPSVNFQFRIWFRSTWAACCWSNRIRSRVEGRAGSVRRQAGSRAKASVRRSPNTRMLLQSNIA